MTPICTDTDRLIADALYAIHPYLIQRRQALLHAVADAAYLMGQYHAENPLCPDCGGDVVARHGCGGRGRIPASENR